MSNLSGVNFMGYTLIDNGCDLEDVTFLSVRTPDDNVLIAVVSTHRDEDFSDHFIAGVMNVHGQLLDEHDADNFSAFTGRTPELFREVILTLILLDQGEDPAEYDIAQRAMFVPPWRV